MEIAKSAEVPYPTACRIVQTLLYEGLIEQEPARKRYRATALVQTLATGFQHDDELVRLARPHIIALTKKVGWPVSVAIRVGRQMMPYPALNLTEPSDQTKYRFNWTAPALGITPEAFWLTPATTRMRACIR